MTEIDDTRIKLNCPNCGPSRWAEVKADFLIRGEDSYSDWMARYCVVQCPACEACYFAELHSNSEDYEMKKVGKNDFEPDYNVSIKQYPESERKETSKPDWLEKLNGSNNKLYDILVDVYKCIDNGMERFAIIGFRTCVDYASEKVGIDNNLPFSAKIEKLLMQGYIGAKEKEQLSTAIDAGNAAIHRGWKPSGDELDTVRLTVENFIFRSFVNPEGVHRLRSAVPKKNSAGE